MIISNTLKFIFVHLHKTGGSSMEQALAPHLSWNDLILGTTELGTAMNADYMNQYGLFDHSSAEDIATVCGAGLFQDYFSFALVRHPVDRAVSMYNFLFSLCTFYCNRHEVALDDLRRIILDKPETDAARQTALAERPFLKWYATEAFLRTATFGDFIRSPLARADRAFMPQVQSVRSLDGKISLSECIKLEEITIQLPRLSSLLGVSLDFQHANKTPFEIITKPALLPDDIAFLKTEYSEDFLAFDYT